jgi:hypothetical protein
LSPPRDDIDNPLPSVVGPNPALDLLELRRADPREFVLAGRPGLARAIGGELDSVAIGIGQ